MIKALAVYVVTCAAMGLGLLLYIATPTYAVTTITVIGNAVPNAAGLTNTIVAFILPIVVAGLFVGLFKGLGVEGGVNTFIIKLSLFIGCLFGMLSDTAAAPTVIPLGLPIIAGVYLVTYIWKGV